MKTTKVMVSEKKIEQYDGDLLVCFVPEAVDGELVCNPLIQKEVSRAHEYGDFSGKTDKTLLFYPDIGESKSSLNARRVLVTGIGKPFGQGDEKDKKRGSASVDEKETDFGKLCAIREAFRQAGGTVSKVCSTVKASKIMVTVPEIAGDYSGEVAESLIEGILLGDYRFTKYKKADEQEPEYSGINEVRVFAGEHAANVRKSVKLGVASAQAACDARDMANEPGNGWKALDFAAYADALAKKYDLKCKIINKEEIKRLGMGGLLAVNQGSAEEPCMVILEYQPKRKSQTILLVGKGLTFDSGGICLKPPAGMADMKYDMCGGAAVIAAMQAVGHEKPGVGVVAIIPATDNLSGSAAMKPGDIIRHYNGITSEIINTDAEGRLILADALAYGIEQYKPSCVVDIATLTGAVITGLGHHYSGVLGNSDELVKLLEDAGHRAGEPLWRLPLGKPYSKQIESKVADIKNTGGKSAGTITAAAYLQHFVGDIHWAHIDIAGTAWDFTEKSYIPKGPSGIGVRTFLELIRNWKKGSCQSR
ncbi:putative cytosol aminopeptidase [Desulfamplus magnetovallimortis]|uniref:Probable cytosol aminopeptidase n=1 Tax=Desulfamplus magnetovallimortis TaxID=1246637 RepID=A0A1W1HD59_9BACT|nr:leucyl aminopeptidase [Desulfamplus magnetovallimortis]SLM30308.1 putative cytosol aminopeptidase [Desulfamplus magnetovallimortis]